MKVILNIKLDPHVILSRINTKIKLYAHMYPKQWGRVNRSPLENTFQSLP